MGRAGASTAADASSWQKAVFLSLAPTRMGEWGRLLEWRDDDGIRHQWAMPLELLQGDGSDVRRELARLGLSIAPGRGRARAARIVPASVAGARSRAVR